MANVKVKGLASSDEIGMKVLGLTRSEESEDGWERRTLYDATIGPDAQGEVDHAIEMPIASGTFDLVVVKASTGENYENCFPDSPPPTPTDGDFRDPRFAPINFRTGGPRIGCLIFTLPRLARLPQLNASLDTGDGALMVGVSADNAPYRALLQISGRMNGSQSLLVRELLIPNNQGLIGVDRKVSIPDGTKTVCALTTWHGSGEEFPPLRCPHRTDNETAWSFIRVPR